MIKTVQFLRPCFPISVHVKHLSDLVLPFRGRYIFIHFSLLNSPGMLNIHLVKTLLSALDLRWAGKQRLRLHLRKRESLFQQLCQIPLGSSSGGLTLSPNQLMSCVNVPIVLGGHLAGGHPILGAWPYFYSCPWPLISDVAVSSTGQA